MTAAVALLVPILIACAQIIAAIAPAVMHHVVLNRKPAAKNHKGAGIRNPLLLA
jgi:hypothetical protein